MKPKRKTSLMYVSILIGWLLTVAWFNPRLCRLLLEADTIPGKGLVLLFILLLDIYWLYGTYYLMHFLFTSLSRDSRVPDGACRHQPAIAVLYLTMNDFDPAAALSCVSQDYENYHVFILDDSTAPEKIEEVSRFSGQCREITTVIRRLDRQGFKAGSLNNALRRIPAIYEYFAVIDADGVIPRNFLGSLIPYFQLDERMGFVQGGNAPNPQQKSRFADDLALGITPLWTSYFGAKNRYGFVPFLGHSGILRREVWLKIGGFPEIVSEDLAFATKALEVGYRGCFAGHVVSLEDFPLTYGQLRRQQEKYVKGGCEFCRTMLPTFVRSSRALWFEKLDVVMSCGTLFLPCIHLCFVIVLGVLLALVLGHEKPLTLTIGDMEIRLWSVYVLKEGFKTIWTLDFYMITLVNMFAPLLGCISLARVSAIRLLRLIVFSSVPYLSLMIVCATSVITYWSTKQALFLVTGDQSEGLGLYSSREDRNRALAVVDASHRAIHWIEIGVGIIMGILCLKTLNLALFAFAACLILGPFLLRYGWDNSVLRTVVCVPFAIILAAIACLGVDLVGSQGLFLHLVSFHF